MMAERGVLAEFGGGVLTLGRGVGLMLRRPRIFLLGAVPPLITSVIFVGLLIVLGENLDRLLDRLTSFAADSPGLHGLFEVLFGVALVGGSVVIMVLTFSAITMALGSPLYDKIAELTERELGSAPEPAPERLSAAIGRAIRQGVALLVVSLLGSVIFFALGFIPAIGQTVVPVLSACFGGWLITLELVSPAFDRRGRFRIGERRAAMRSRRARCLGFGVSSFLLIAIPFLSVFVFPAATAGGTILAREILTSEGHRDRSFR